jgi:hypothetical protein
VRCAPGEVFMAASGVRTWADSRPTSRWNPSELGPRCGGSAGFSSYRFLIPLEATEQAGLTGQPIYLYGVAPAGFSLLVGSGNVNAL